MSADFPYDVAIDTLGMIDDTGEEGAETTVYVEAPSLFTEDGAVVFLQADGAYLDREGTVSTIEALTDLVEVHDAEEAKKAAAAVERIKRGYRVDSGMFRWVALTDEVDGHVDVYNLDADLVLKHCQRGDFTIVSRAGR